ncbi:MAG TPA: hypothetical protein VFO00_07315, partial [Vitreimonas sp.]|nr:hypothetical protein [Vitreimonas sp.]
MSGAQSWSVKGIDPKVREAAREAAARQGMSLGEYLNHALAGHQPGNGAESQAPRPPRANRHLGQEPEGEDDWSVAPRTADPTRLAQRIESIERRTQLAVTGLDRAVSTIDRSVLGLAARVEDAEAASMEASDRIAEALEQFRAAGEALSGKLARAEQESTQSADVRQRLEHQVNVAEEVARRAEAAASYLTQEMENRDSALKQTLAEARAVAEEAARQASEASADAVAELRRLQENLSERLTETQTSTRRAIETAVAETTGAREALLEEVTRLENEIARRVGSVEDLRSEHAALISRIERA